MSLFQRVETREKQFVAWRNLIAPAAYTRARLMLGLIDAVRIALYLVLVIALIKSGIHMATLVVAFIIGWGTLSLGRAVARDKILEAAFATMGTTTVRGTTSAAPVSMQRARVKRAAKQQRIPQAYADRDAVDFDDAA